jgi:non-heme chloroperoxidase
MPHIEASDGTRLFYYDGGTGPVAVFVHAWSLSSAMWEYQVAAFREAGYRCVALDRRGHGRSDVPGSGYDLDTLAGDLATLLDRLDLRRVTFVAHSMGTVELTRYLAGYGSGRAERAAYVGAMTPCLLRRDDNPGGLDPHHFERTAAALRADRPRWFHEGAAAYFATGGTGAWVSAALVDEAVRSILATPLEVQTDTLRTLGSDLRADLRSIDIPTLVVHGDADASAPIDLTGRPTAALLPSSSLEVYAGAPHGLYVTEKDRLNKDLLAFAAAR